MSTSVKDFFERRVPDALSRHPEKAKEVAATFLFTIAGADAEPGPPTHQLAAICQSGCIGQPQCTIEITDEDFRSMIDGGPRPPCRSFWAAG